MKRFKAIIEFFGVTLFVLSVFVLQEVICDVNIQSAEQIPSREFPLDGEFVPDVKVWINGSSYYKTFIFKLYNESSVSGGKVSLTVWDPKMSNQDSLFVTVDGLSNRTWSISGTNKKDDWEVEDASVITVFMLGDWTSSSASLIATFYYESTNNKCPANYIKCQGDEGCKVYKSDEARDNSTRQKCISMDLKCNHRPNCGLRCEDEENDCYYIQGLRQMKWYEVQYLLTILLAGLFFILSPICIVIFLFYHRRLNMARNFERQRGQSTRSSVYTSSPANDLPPTYEDVHETKNPPPSFESATQDGTTSTPQTATQYQSQFSEIPLSSDN